jgi:hypothetical protein
MAAPRRERGDAVSAAILRDALSAVTDTIPAMAALRVPERIIKAEECADLIASAAGVLFTPVPKKPPEDEPGHADVADAITRGLAILACRPGGVTFGGLHWHHGDHEDCPGPGELNLTGLDHRQAKGAYFTPRKLAEEVTLGGIEPLVYNPGPLQTGERDEWRLVPSNRILDLRIADISVGSGVFLVAGVRYLAGRLAEAWRLEADGTPPPVWPYNKFPPLDSRDPLTMAARRLVIRCFHGVDIDQTSVVELARLTLALMAPTVPVLAELTIVQGDSLLGIRDVEQLIKGHIDPPPGWPDMLDRKDRLSAARKARWRARDAFAKSGPGQAQTGRLPDG